MIVVIVCLRHGPESAYLYVQPSPRSLELVGATDSRQLQQHMQHMRRYVATGLAPVAQLLPASGI